MTALTVRHGGALDAPRLLRLFDDAVAWMVARGQTDQWGAEPFSASAARVEKVRAWAAGGGLWLAEAGGAGADPTAAADAGADPAAADGAGAGPAAADGAGAGPAGAIVLGDAPDYVPPADCPELYVQVLLTASAWRHRGVGARLIEHAVRVARGRGAARLRVDCWDGVPALPSQYARLGFERVGSFSVGDWPGAILTRAL